MGGVVLLYLSFAALVRHLLPGLLRQKWPLIPLSSSGGLLILSVHIYIYAISNISSLYHAPL